jgi:hypothetical protein
MCVALYFSWYKHLPPPAPQFEDDEMVAEEAGEALEPQTAN